VFRTVTGTSAVEGRGRCEQPRTESESGQVPFLTGYLVRLWSGALRAAHWDRERLANSAGWLDVVPDWSCSAQWLEPRPWKVGGAVSSPLGPKEKVGRFRP